MFFMPKIPGFTGKTGGFPVKKVEKTIAILLQNLYTKKASGEKWREKPLYDS